MTNLQKRILVVEDENIVSMDLRLSLERLGYHVTGCVGTGEQAIASVRTEPPDLVLMDVQLRGDMDGTQAAAVIRQQFDVPVVYLTAYSNDATLEKARVTEPFGYILKPFEERELHVVIEMALFRKEAQTQHERLLKEQVARAAVESERKKLKFLAEAGERLAASMDLKGTLDDVVGLAVPELADWAALHVKEADRVRTLVVKHAGGGEHVIWELMRRYPLPEGHPRGYPRVIHTREPELRAQVDDEHLQAMALDGEHLHLLRALGTRSEICVPLVVRGEAFGALTLATGASGRVFGPEDLELVTDLARRCATAIDNARLYDAAQRAIALRDEFLSVAAHELRTPLTSLVLAFQRFEERLKGVGEPALGAKFTLLVQQFDRLTDLVERLLDLSRLSAGKLDIKPGRTDLARVVRDVVQRFEEEAHRAGTAVSVSGPLELVGVWDRTRLEQVLTNLVGNALKFSTGKPVEVSVQGEDGLASVTIRDHGIGIPEEKLPLIFERFGRGVPARSYGGLGLGLYVARQLVEAHGGQIRVTSAVGEGTTFSVDLPRRLEMST
jgi:signal transduction histidine kinase/AmiR/NasT family two-component response regulator